MNLLGILRSIFGNNFSWTTVNIVSSIELSPSSTLHCTWVTTFLIFSSRRLHQSFAALLDKTTHTRIMLLQLSWGQLQRNQLLSTQMDRLVFLHAPKCVDRFARQCYYKPSIRISPDFTVLILKPLKLDWSDNSQGFLWFSEIHTGTMHLRRSETLLH